MQTVEEVCYYNRAVEDSKFLKIPKYEYIKVQEGTSTYIPNSDLVFQSEKFDVVLKITKENMKAGVPINLAQYIQEYLYNTAGIMGRFTRSECDAIFLEAALIGSLGFTNGTPCRKRNSIIDKIHAYFTYMVLRCCGSKQWCKIG